MASQLAEGDAAMRILSSLTNLVFMMTPTVRGLLYRQTLCQLIGV